MHHVYNTIFTLYCQEYIILYMMNKKDDKINNKLGSRIKIERMKRDITQEKLSELSGISRLAISNIERGINSPTIETVEKIANAFEMDILELLNFSNISI